MEWVCFQANLREDNKVSESKMAVSESKMAEFKMAAIIKLSQNEWVKFYYVQNVAESNLGRVSRWLPSSSWVRNELRWSSWCPRLPNSMMAEFKMTAIIKLSENEWVWSSDVQLVVKSSVVSEEWVSRQIWDEDESKVSESKMTVSKMTAIINLSAEFNDGCQSDWISLIQNQNGVRVLSSESERR